MPEISSFDFHDFDSFREQLRGWDTDPVQLTAGPLRLAWDELRFEGLGIAHLRVNQRIADASAVDSGSFGFVVALRPQIWCGLEVPAGSLVVLAPEREHRSVLGADFHSVEVTVSLALLHEFGLIADGSDPRAFPPERCVVPLDQPILVEFERIAIGLRGGSVRPVSQSWRSAVGPRILSLLGRALRQCAAPGIRRVARYELALAALRLADRGGEEPLTARGLAEALGVTPRALEYAFDSTLAVPPARYLLARRLNRVRRDLLTSDAATVTDVASRRGFNHLGRFAEQYRRLFGELPSQTPRPRDFPKKL